MFIGSNDIATCEEFSKLCGNMTVTTGSVSSGMGSKSSDINYSQQMQTRPVIYPSELQKLNSKTNTGNAIIVTFGNNPLKTKFTPSYKCPLYEFKAMNLDEVRANAFYGEDVYYDLGERNMIVQQKIDAEMEEQEEPHSEAAAGEEAELSGGLTGSFNDDMDEDEDFDMDEDLGSYEEDDEEDSDSYEEDDEEDFESYDDEEDDADLSMDTDDDTDEAAKGA